MNTFNKMRFSLAVLLAAWACLADMAHTGVSSLRSKRMVGGLLAPHVPWQAMIYLNDSVLDGGYAGGALISDRWVLTAGRNLFVRKSREDIQGKDPVIPKVYLGIRLREQAKDSTEHAVDKIVLHPRFQNQSDWDNDLALIKLKKPVVMSEKVTPIPLPEKGQDLGTSGFITGWGWGAHLTPSMLLKYTVLPLAKHDECKKFFEGTSHRPVVDDHMFCTGPSEHHENVCFGDAGGALTVIDSATGDVYATGILSYDKPCRSDPYAVYMKISSYLPWIHSVIRGDTDTSSAVRIDTISKMLKWITGDSASSL
ncbi:hypothetical protein PAMA_000553 [Pampus argenteus]